MSELNKESLERALKTLETRELSWREKYDMLSEKEKNEMEEVVVSSLFGDVLVPKLGDEEKKRRVEALDKLLKKIGKGIK